MENKEDAIRLEKARKKVKDIKGFYKHFIVYVVVNIFFWVMKLVSMGPKDVFFEWSTFITAICWGIGLFCHWYSVFCPNLIVGKDWEERKINEYMEREKTKRQRWE